MLAVGLPGAVRVQASGGRDSEAAGDLREARGALAQLLNISFFCLELLPSNLLIL